SPRVTCKVFTARSLWPSDADGQAMLETLGFASLDALIEAAVPAGIRLDKPLALPEGLGEAEALAELKAIAARNRLFTNCIGQGYYGTHTPSPILRNLLENPGW